MASIAKFTTRKPEAGTVHWLNTCIERGKREVFSEVATITPGLAAELLRRNEGNRGIKQTKAEQYAADMRKGNWSFNGEAVIVSDTGELNDGQHRMQALVDANTSLPFLVVFGVTRKSRETVDQGAARGAGDYLIMGGMKNATTASTIARLIIAFERSDGQDIHGKEITNAEVVQRARADGDIAQSAHFGVTVGRKARNYCAGTLIGFCHYILSEIDQHDAEDYLTQVCTGEGLKHKDPALTVRERLLIEGKSRNRKLAIILRGWNFYRRSMKVGPASLPAKLPLPALI